MGAPLQDIVAEGRRVADVASGVEMPLLLTGGLAIALHCPSARVAPLRRDYADIDMFGRGRDGQRISELLSDNGYEADSGFNAIHGATRLFFWDPGHERQLDVFLDRFEMCHTIDLRDRLDQGGRTIPLADLLLTKLQVVETNEKDYLDILALLHDQPFTEDAAGIELPYLVELTASDWGLWRTTTMVAERAARFARELPGFAGAERVGDQVARYLEALEQSDKSRSWRLRARVGDRKRWYELPEESH